MYNFVDTIEVSGSYVLPSEALQLNGDYIENQISGYRTLNVSGREALSPEVESYTTGVRDGSWLKHKRYPERIITVKYQLVAESSEAFREAYNKLGAILNVKDARLIFNDEQDKFFIGTPCTIGAVEPGRNAVVGEFEILCTDPFKYSVMEYEAEANLIDNGFLIEYKGTHKSYPTLEAAFYSEDESSAALTGNGDCGYVAFFNEEEKIIQLGDPDEADTAEYARSQTLVSQMFDKETAWGTVAQTNWATNVGKLFSSNVQQSGSVNPAVSAYLTTVSPTTSGTLLTKESTQAKPNIKYTVTAQASGREDDKVNFKVTVSAYVKGVQNTSYENTAQAGMAIRLPSAGVLLYKASDSTSASARVKGTYYLWDTSIKNGRIRITTPKSNAGKSGQVTGWVDVDEIGVNLTKKVVTTTGLEKGYGLKAAIQLGSSGWKYVTLKEENATWGANTTYTKTLDVTVKDIDADTTEIEDIKFKVERTDNKEDKVGIIEETDCPDFEISTYTAPVANEWYLAPQTFGTHTGWHGPSITRTIPADAAGDVGAANFSFSFRHKIGIGTSSYATQELGTQTVLLVGGSGANRKVVAGFEIAKDTNGTKGKVRFYVNGKHLRTAEIDLSNAKAVARGSTITKALDYISFDVGGIKWSYGLVGLANLSVNEITVHFGQYGTKPALSYNGIYWAKFVKNNCDTWNDIPNKFSSNDVLIADCKNGEVYLNGVLTPALGALGNDLEAFCLTPGLNQIGFSYSDWVAAEYAPTFRVRYREVFL